MNISAVGNTTHLGYQLRTMKKYEVIDGCPTSSDIIPFRFPLRGIVNLSPTLKNVMNKFSVRYYIKCIVNEHKSHEEENAS